MRFEAYSAGVSEESLAEILMNLRRGFIMEISQIDRLVELDAMQQPNLSAYFDTVRRARLQTVRNIEKRCGITPWKKKKNTRHLRQ